MSESIIKLNGAVIRQQKNTILKNVDIDIRSGEFVYLIGKVGSGKSSLLKTLYAELPLEYGSAEVAGFQLKKIKKSQVPLLRRKCGIVFQDFKLLIDRNVYANLEFVLRATGWNDKKAIRERIETVLEKVGMPDKKDKMPHQLSGGEQQRIVLARALLNAPPIILADEPTGNIDPETSYLLIQLLKEICETGKTIVIATHQYDLIERFPGRVLRCQDGEIIEVINEQIPADGEIAEEQIAIIEQEIEAAENRETAEDSDIDGQQEKIAQIMAEEPVVDEVVQFYEESGETAGIEEIPQPPEETVTAEEPQTPEEKQPELPFVAEEQATDTPEQEPEQVKKGRKKKKEETEDEALNNRENSGKENTGGTDDTEKKEGQTPPPVFGFDLID